MSEFKLPKTPISQNVLLKRRSAGSYEGNEWVDPKEIPVAILEDAVIIPGQGRELAEAAGTRYESDYTLYVGAGNVFIIGQAPIPEALIHGTAFEAEVYTGEEEGPTWPKSPEGEVQAPGVFQRGDIVKDSMGRVYTLVFPGMFGMAYVAALKEVVPDGS